MSTRRPYRSKLRQERAEDTRRRIRDAARQLFTQQGFTETTVTQIAEHAGVSAQAIYATYGSKAAIVAALLDGLEAEAGLDNWIAKFRAEPDPRRQLHLFGAWIRTLFETGADVIRAALAAGPDADLAALADRGDRRRRAGIDSFVRDWSDQGVLRPGLPTDQASDLFWLITSAELYFLAIDRLGWSADHYEEWVTALLERELLSPETGRGIG